ncbi:MAG: Crp/Fnr family transcriptional regulator [Actinobacteria bacterium]|nr:Crp/Fnr family transcriptional regulator [Actinomycetota bacterium]
MDFALFGSLSTEESRRVLASSRRRRFARREVLFHEGDPGDTLHLIDKGRVAVRITTPLGDVATVDVFGRGDAVGLLAILEEGGRRHATVTALEATETLSLDRGQLDELRLAHRAIDRFLMEMLAAHLRRADTQLVEALFVPVERRLLRRLEHLCRVYDSGAGEVQIPLTQEDLSSMAGTSRATTNRGLRQLEDDKVVTLARNRVHVFDTDEVARRAR